MSKTGGQSFKVKTATFKGDVLRKICFIYREGSSARNSLPGEVVEADTIVRKGIWICNV